MGKLLAGLALLTFAAGIVFADNITIAVVPKGLDNPVFEPTRIAAEKEAKKLGVTLLQLLKKRR